MKITGQAEAQKAVSANTTPRMLQLSKLRQYVDGSQYEGRPKWYDKSRPVWDREPCVVWQAPEGAITANEDLLLGDGRYPVITSRPEEDDESESDEALDEESSEELDRFIRSSEREAKLRSHCRESYRDSQSVGTSIGLFGARGGRLFAEVIQAEFATAELNDRGACLKLEIQYPYLELQKDRQGNWKYQALLFRRVIDDKQDITYKPAVAREDGTQPNWQEDPEKTTTHGFGFCPVVYHKFRSKASIVNQKDGRAIHATVLDELDAYNIETSTRHEGAMYSLPQIWETGVEPGYNPTDDASVDAGLVATSNPESPANPVTNPIREQYVTTTPRPSGSRKQGPGHIWQYDNKDVKVGQIDTSGESLTALAETITELRARICETLAWVPLNPEDIKFAATMSGKALERILARQINRVAKDRDGFGDGYMIAAYCMVLRIAQKLGASLKTRGISKALPILTTFADLSDGWNDPPLTLKWGPWFHPTAEDEKFVLDSTIEAREAKLITLRTALERISTIYDIEDVTAYLDTLKEENAADADEAAQQEADAMARFHATAGANDPNGTPAGGGGKPKANSPGGTGGAGSPPGNPAKAKAKDAG